MKRRRIRYGDILVVLGTWYAASVAWGLAFHGPLSGLTVEFFERGLDYLFLRILAFFPWWLGPPVAVAAAVYAWLQRDRRRSDGYLHCLNCDYILKGLPEPRCPECGERI